MGYYSHHYSFMLYETWAKFHKTSTVQAVWVNANRAQSFCAHFCILIAAKLLKLRIQSVSYELVQAFLKHFKKSFFSLTISC